VRVSHVRAVAAASLLAGLVSLSCVNDTRTEAAVLDTTLGRIEIAFFPQFAPLAVENFIGLAEAGYYDGSIFHRVIKEFIIQGGDPSGTGFDGHSLWGVPFPDEFDDNIRFDRPGRVGMANSGPDTNGSQFFIILTPTPHLNDRHTLFAEVISGMDVVEAISEVAVDNRAAPLEPVVVTSVTIEHLR
jgi:cyclophilin family peptidyl-prolyl cis-trans isomerase